MLRFSIILLSFISFISVRAQESVPFCATDELHQQLFLEHPEYNAGIVRANERLKQFTEEYLRSDRPKSGPTYVIPVVFHIIHNNGIENIEDSQILDAIKQVNLQYRKLNSDTSEIVTSFKSIAADVEIELRLAQLDPNGNCTSGITRTVSPLTSIGDHQVKSLIQWPPDKYLNVYVCNQAATLAGHAMMPAAADTVPQWDGIVMQHSYVGTIGTSEFFRRTVLSHEIGHYLNLYHIWGGNNVPDYYYLPVAQAGNCAFDDEVSDTPLTIGWQNCNLGGSSCSSLDNVQNYMDYAYCARMFTEGQKQRMHACLNSPVANRNNLWSPANLVATGTDDQTFYLCGAKFEADKRLACVGDVITLTDVSYHGVETRTWNLPGATASSLTDSIVTATYSTPGVYPVTINVTQGVQQKDMTIVDFIRILPAVGTVSSLYEPFENELVFNDNWAILPKNTAVNWEIDETIGYMSGQSIAVHNFADQTTGIYEFVSEPFDASGLSAIAMSFDYAYAKDQTVTNELLQVLVSNDCGATWTVRRSLYASSTLTTVDTLVTSNFVPANSGQWASDVVSNITAAYLTNDLMFKFKFDARGGNNIYIDNIRIAHPDELGIENELMDAIEVYPNPTKSELSVKFPSGISNSVVELLDLNGQEVEYSLLSLNAEAVQIGIEHLASGVYLLKIASNQGLRTIKIIKE
jgi:hypothetical protein